MRRLGPDPGSQALSLAAAQAESASGAALENRPQVETHSGTICSGSADTPAQAPAPLGCPLRSQPSFLSSPSSFSPMALTPLLGGDGLGLVGADEPRYAQIAHEMLDRFDSAHTLKGASAPASPLISTAIPGWRSRPSTTGAPCSSSRSSASTTGARGCPRPPSPSSWSALIYLHMRRFRPGGHLDAALITVACAGIIGFSRGASTDMQMAAPLAIGLLGWYAWYETDSKFWLFDIYFFTGVATLAKGPVAPFLAAVIICCLCLPAPRVVHPAPLLLVAGHRCSTSPWCCPGSSPCSTRTPPSSASSSSNTTWSALPPTATSTSSPSGTTWWWSLLAMMPWTVIAIRALWPTAS